MGIVLNVNSQSSNQNYIKTSTYIKTGAEFIDEIQYFDGLGRPVEAVQKEITPSNNDLVTYTEYDVAGREYCHWLPVVSKQDNNGLYVDTNTFKSESSNFYDSLINDDYPYTETILESSPLDRTIGQRNPGAAWNTHPIQVKYEVNDATVAYFFVNSSGALQRGNNYAANTLYKTTTTDEDGNTKTEYKDKLGQIIMKRIGKNADTYYVYNDLGQLAYVLPPLASDALGIGIYNDNTTLVLEQYAYIYKYDERGNCTYKRLPGCEPICMVYDKANRLVLSQDGNQRDQKQYTITKYDRLGRVLYTGVINRDIIQSEKDLIHNSVIIETIGTTNQLKDTGYTCNTFANEILPLTVNYYDNYQFLDFPGADAYLKYVEDQDFSVPYISSYPSGDLGGFNAKGSITGDRTYLLDGSGKYTVTAMYYDDKGRVVQSRSTNYMGGYDIVYNDLDFTGNPNKVLKEHNIAGQAVISELYTNTYDHAGRLKETWYRIGDNNPVLLASNTYDELGRLETKNRHNNNDTEEFKYNIRNWTTRIKSGDFEENLYYNSPPSNITVASPCYNGNISYSTWTYNGTIKAYNYYYDDLNRYRGGYCYIDNELQDIGFYSEGMGYDKMGNITSLGRWDGEDIVDQLTLTYNGNQLKSVSDNGVSPNLYGVKEYQNKSITDNEFAYDKNGNMIKDLDRDIVTIKYNLLNLPDTVQFKNGNQIVNLYDVSGNKLGDEYYTILHGVQVPISAGQILNIKNIYGPDEVDVIKKFYVDNITYNWNIMSLSPGHCDLEKVYNTEGYVDNAVGYYRYNYYRKDHLGNNREVWRASYKLDNYTYPAATIQSTQYYPSGLPWGEGTGSDVQSKKYNGKEWIEAHGYDMYDYGARGYYPAICRFTTVDPLAEKYYSVSPYAYCMNNPIRFIDPDGRFSSDFLVLSTNFLDSKGDLVKHIDDGSNAVFQQTGSGVNLYYKFTGYDVSQGGENVINLESAIEEQQSLNIMNPYLQEGPEGTHCNQATQNILKTVASAVGNPSIIITGLANEMDQKLKKGNINFLEVDEATARINAVYGGISLITYFNPIPRHSGHILTFSVGQNRKKGDVANIGPSKFTGFVPLNRAISKQRKKSYFIYVPNVLPNIIVTNR
ncbi:DUF6443 domain-containing protein [uncultured Bacteroides sp.]|uniref:DUF6443 domain-containing protein n=1 Tax=uncultured Bacteroides sp. TaxID=162156 RepID=UPI002AAC0DA5|nr:DUF6443 domain-containing protein [uncultured Bacteroides sp.]